MASQGAKFRSGKPLAPPQQPKQNSSPAGQICVQNRRPPDYELDKGPYAMQRPYLPPKSRFEPQNCVCSPQKQPSSLKFLGIFQKISI